MYSVYAGDICIYSNSFTLDDTRAINPKLSLEDNTAGSFSITLPPSNVGYSAIKRMVTDISIRKDGIEIWAGRVLSESEDFFGNRTLTCEGEFAFFNDSVQPPAEYPGLSVRDYLETLIGVHNSKVSENRRFTIGAVTVQDENFPTCYTNYEKTMTLFSDLVERYGGHFRVRKEEGVRYLDYLAEYPDTCSQTINFGTNLIDFTKQWDSSDFVTVLVPLGNKLENSPIEALDAYLTVESVNNGSIYVQSDEAVAAYGWIEKSVAWDDVTDVAKLLELANAYLSDIQFDNMVLELSALDLHYLDANVEEVKLLDEIRVVSPPHGLDRMFPVTKLDIPLDAPEQTQFSLGSVVRTSLTAASSQSGIAIMRKLDEIPKAHLILKEAKENATHLMKMATTGFITITKDEYGADTLYISNTRDYDKSDKLWKWNMNGLGYSNDGGTTFGTAITMDGAIVANYITSGVLNANVIRAGVLKDVGGNVSFDLGTGTLTMKKGSISIGGVSEDDAKFSVNENGELYARHGTFAGTLEAATGTFGGQLVAVTGDFRGIVRASDFQTTDENGDFISMVNELGKFKSGYLDLYGLTITKDGTTTFKVSDTGEVTINGKVTMGAGSTIDWSTVGNDNLSSNPAYSKAESAATKADAANTKAIEAYNKASSIYVPSLPSYITSTKITKTTIESPIIKGGRFEGGQFDVLAEETGAFNLKYVYNSQTYHALTMEFYNSYGIPYAYIYSPCSANFYIGNPSNQNHTVGFIGNVDFSEATVSGITATFG